MVINNSTDCDVKHIKFYWVRITIVASKITKRMIPWTARSTIPKPEAIAHNIPMMHDPIEEGRVFKFSNLDI